MPYIQVLTIGIDSTEWKVDYTEWLSTQIYRSVIILNDHDFL